MSKKHIGRAQERAHYNLDIILLYYGRYITKQKRAPLNCAKFLPSGAVTNAFPTEFR